MDEQFDGSQVRAQAITETDHALADAHALLERAEAELREIEKAINSFGLGSDSRCEVCGVPIEADRIAASPGERRCEEHAVRD
jgi:RNA polymerase-binding transcription factor DksA